MGLDSAIITQRDFILLSSKREQFWDLTVALLVNWENNSKLGVEMKLQPRIRGSELEVRNSSNRARRGFKSHGEDTKPVQVHFLLSLQNSFISYSQVPSISLNAVHQGVCLYD